MFGMATCFALLLILTIGTIRRPAVAFAGILCLFGLKQWGQNSSVLLAENRTIVNFAIALIVVIGVLRNWSIVKRQVQFISPLWLLVLALYAYAFISVVWAPELQTSLDQWVAAIPYLLMIVVLAPLLLSDADGIRSVVHWTVSIGGTVCALALVYGTWGMRGLLVHENSMATAETNPLAIANLGGTIVVVSVVSLMAPGRTYARLMYMMYILMIPIGLAVVLRSGSRGQLIVAAAAALVGMLMASRRRNFWSLLIVAVSVAAIAAVGWWIWNQLGVQSNRWTGDQSAEDVRGRIQMATTLLSVASSNAATLVAGLGNSSSFHYLGIYPHIAPLEVLAEEGIIGLGLYVAICVLAFRSTVVLWRYARSLQDAGLHYGVSILAALFLFEWFLTFKQATLLSSTYAFAYAIILDRLRIQVEGSVQIRQRPVASADIPVVYGNLMK
jgi:hypothetical protein